MVGKEGGEGGVSLAVGCERGLKLKLEGARE